MIELHTWSTPNGRKPLILLHELGLSFELRPVDIGKGDQRSDAYLKLNPNGKIPTVVDLRGGPRVVIVESGAILIHLAEQAGRFLAPRGQPRADAIGWLMFQMSAVGPMFGQAWHFKHLEPKVPYGEERYGKEVERIAGVLDQRLGRVEYLAGEYSIADMATYPWCAALPELGVLLDDKPGLAAWMKRVGERDAVKKAMDWDPAKKDDAAAKDEAPAKER